MGKMLCFLCCILEFSSWRQVINDYGSTKVSQYKSFISTISLHFLLHIRCNLFNDSDFLFAMLATVQKHRKLPIVVSTTIKYMERCCSSFFIRVHGCKFAYHVYIFLQEELLHEAMKER